MDNEVSSKDFKRDIILLKDLKENVNIRKQEMEKYFLNIPVQLSMLKSMVYEQT